MSVSISSFPNTINQDVFNLTASVSGASAGTNYLRVDIFKEGTENYFGQTYNGNDWYSGSTYTQYYPITIQSGVFWSGNIQARVGSPSQSEYDGTGNYKIRIRRYTESGGSNASEANAGAVSLSVNIPTLTPTPAPPTSTPKLTPTAIPTPTPTPAKVITSASVLKPTLKVTDKASSKVLSYKTENLTSTPEPTVRVLNDTQKSLISDKNFIPKIFISIGIVFLILCGIVIFYPIIKKIKDKNTNE